MNNPNFVEKVKKYIVAIVLGLVILVILVVFLSFKTQKPKDITKEADILQLDDSEFDIRDTKSVVEAQEIEIQKLQDNLQLEHRSKGIIENKLEQINIALKESGNQTKELLEDAKSNFKKQLESLKEQAQEQKRSQQKDDSNDSPFSGDNNSQTNQNISVNLPSQISFAKVSAKYAKPIEEHQFKKTLKNYIPAGTFCKAVTLSGAEAHTGVYSQSNTTPMLFKLVGDCVMPHDALNRSLNGAFITASVYGEISTERGIVRLDNISFVDKATQESFEIPVEGTISDISGRNGIKGIPTLNNTKILAAAGLTGLLSGVGDAVGQASSTQSVTGSGIVNQLNPSNVGYAVAGGALKKSTDRISDYYIKLAESYSPALEIHAGSVVNVIFLKGFPIKNKKAISYYSEAVTEKRLKANQKPDQLQNLIGTNQHIDKEKIKSGIADQVNNSPLENMNA